MNERRFKAEAGRLRSPQRLALLQIDRVVVLGTEGYDPGSVLDVGTGTGLFAEAFLNAGWLATGTDVNAELLELARAEVPAAQFLASSAEKLTFDSDAFDLVFLGQVLHEIDRPIDALREARRVARRRVVVLEWPYREEKHGPPLAHRLKPESILRMADEIDFRGGERIKLEYMDLYRLTP